MKRLARDLGISHTYISHIERGKSQPSESLIRKFAARESFASYKRASHA